MNFVVSANLLPLSLHADGTDDQWIQSREHNLHLHVCSVNIHQPLSFDIWIASLSRQIIK